MSRYIRLLANGRSIAYGFDNPLQEYFITEFLSKQEVADAEAFNQKLIDEYGEENAPWDQFKPDEVAFSIMSHTTTQEHPDFPGRLDWSNSEILELIKTYPFGIFLPEHIYAIEMDMPF